MAAAGASFWKSTPITSAVINSGTQQSPVHCVQFNSERILAGFADGVTRLYDTESHMRLWNLEGHRGAVNSLRFRDARMVTGSDDKTIRVWDMNVGNCIEKLEDHIAPILCVVMTDRHVISGSRDHTIKIWDIEKGNCLRTLRGHTGRVGGIQLVENSATQFMTCSTDGTVKLWDINADQRIRSYKGHKKAVVAFHLFQDEVISSADDLSLKVWDKKSCRCMRTFTVEKEKQVSRSIAMDSGKIVCGDADGVIRLRDPLTGEVQRTLEGHEGAVTCLQVDNANNLIISGSEDRTLRAWSSPNDAAEVARDLGDGDADAPANAS